MQTEVGSIGVVGGEQQELIYPYGDPLRPENSECFFMLLVFILDIAVMVHKLQPMVTH